MDAISLRTLSLPMRALFSCFLLMIGLGYLAALSYLFLVDVAPHTAKGQGVIEGIAEKYHGAPTRLEVALRGPMADKINTADRQRIVSWIRAGAQPEAFAAIKPVIEANCITCHSAKSGVQRPGSTEPVPSFETVDDLLRLVEIDTGPTIAQLAKVSHVHLFGISIIFLITGFIFALSETPASFRVLLIVVPYAAIFADIGAWWLTKWEAVFAWVVVIGGALMGAALGLQILISLFEMWIARSRRRVPLSPALKQASSP